MTLMMQAVVDLERLQRESADCEPGFPSLLDEVQASLARLRTTLGTALAPDAVPALPAFVAPDTVLLWFVSGLTDDEFLATADALSPQMKRRIILFDYVGDHPARFVESTGFGGLVAWESVRNCLFDEDAVNIIGSIKQDWIRGEVSTWVNRVNFRFSSKNTDVSTCLRIYGRPSGCTKAKI